MDIHKAIKSRRERKGWSQTDLAAAVSRLEGSSKVLAWQTVQQWENGGSAPKRARLGYVAEALGCTVEELMGLQQPAAAVDLDEPIDWRTTAYEAADAHPDKEIRDLLLDFCDRVDAKVKRLEAARLERAKTHTA